MTEEALMNIQDIKNYEQIRTPDMGALANYLSIAKGPYRTMAQFAEETNIGPSTLSRIMTCSAKKPLSIDILIRIFENRANKSDEFLLEALLNANGLVSKDYAERVKIKNDFAARRNIDINRARLMKNTLIAEVIACGFNVNRIVTITTCRFQKLPPLYPKRRGDFALYINTDDNCPQSILWSFFLYPKILENTDPQIHRTPEGETRHILESVSPWFVLDAWEPNSLVNSKFSFVFADESLFSEFVTATKSAKLHTEMTALLIDPINYNILQEVWIPGEYQKLYSEDIFKENAFSIYDTEGDDESEDYDVYF